MNFQWFEEYESTFFQSLFFSEYEMYQQPFGHIFICSITDDLETLKNLKKKDIPLLLYEGIYEIRMPTMILVLYDQSDELLQTEKIFKKLDQIRNDNSQFYVYFTEINGNKNEESINDIWSRYIHKIDYYKNINKEGKSSQNVHDPLSLKGKLISLEEKDNLRKAILNFFSEFIKPYLQKTVYEIDEEVNSSKKGVRNSFLSIFRKSDKIEYIMSLNIYKFTALEKRMYLLAIIQFYFRDFENAAENLKLLLGDIKVKDLNLV